MKKSIAFISTILAVLLLVLSIFSGVSAQKPKEQNSIPLSVTHNEYFIEKITRAEAIRRLDEHELDSLVRQFIIENLPDTTYHYLVFKDSLFFEYITFGDEIISYRTLKTHAPVIGADSFLVQIPVDSCLRNSLFVKDKNGKLIEDGVSKSPPFSYSRNKTTLLISTEPLFRELPCSVTSDPIGCLCKLACYYVHSQLNIHWLDGICCFFL